MKKEQIEEAAQEYCVIDRSIYNDRFQPYYINGFKDGAEWRINSVWHSGNEVPKKHKDLLIELKNMEFHICQFKDGDSFLGYYDDREFIAFEVISWAYIEDLLPNTDR